MTASTLEFESLPGIGRRRAAEWRGLGIETAEDLLYHLPFRYEDRRRAAQVTELVLGGPEATLLVTVRRPRLIRTRRRGFTLFEAQLEDTSGSATAIWYNQPYLVRSLVEGKRLFVFGRLSKTRMRRDPVLENPDWEAIAEGDLEGVHTGRIVPVYRKLGSASSKALRRAVHSVLARVAAEDFPEPLPPELVSAIGETSRLEALREVHFPSASEPEALASGETPAHRRLAFEETYLVQLALVARRGRALERAERPPYRVDEDWKRAVGKRLPFRLTSAQQRALREIRSDLVSPRPMYRLLQGDVGSGKTIVAFLAMEMARENDRQAALLAPTEILAEQHRANLERFLGDDASRIGYLVGSLGLKARRTVLEGFAQGSKAFAVGTHALFEPDVAFRNLGLVVVDEQQRFGVAQRESLVTKGEGTDVLVMTATPIPRSLALTVWGDLDLSVLDERPPGRRPIRTVVREESGREKVYRGLRDQLAEGRQSYVVVPRVEEGGKEDLKAAVETHRVLAEGPLADHSVGLLHGRMKSDEKDAAMRRFVEGETQVLVSTTVVEVGVDVPNATVMIVEHAERFGLAQLHQLRGRIGRGAHDSYCVLMVGGEESDAARRRLAVLERTDDGFEIAAADLEQRGPGALFGTAQSGLSDLQFVALALKNPELLEMAREEALRRTGTAEGLAEAERVLEGLRPTWKRRLAWAGIG
ncbi:MAG: ATP-dependent DNA helicase RecG [Planctomycetota bacterium]|nr:ATP-dependent DNA helicase RecG [Planctomycetota bacterium]